MKMIKHGMRKAWLKIVLLCVACIICMSGLCLAYVPEEGNWVRYWPKASYPYYLDVDSVKVTEYNGRKYLEYVSIGADYKGFYTRDHMLLDIENGNKKMLFLSRWELVIQNDKLVSERQMSSHDISDITTDEAYSGDGWLTGSPDEAIQWVEQNRPDIINEINTYNRSSSGGRTDVTGPRSNTRIDPAPGVDRQPGTQGGPRITPQSSYYPSAQKQIPENAPHWGNSHYAIYTYGGDSFTWEQAEQYCENMGGHLVTITSPQEQAFIELLNSDHRRLWIGAHRPEGTYFAWVTGEPWSYTNWDEGEPSNKGVGGFENCVVLWPRKWNDLKNDNSWEQSGFICEWDD